VTRRPNRHPDTKVTAIRRRENRVPRAFKMHTISPQTSLTAATAVTWGAVSFKREKPAAKAAGIPHQETMLQ